jgi:hypothetical protein
LVEFLYTKAAVYGFEDNAPLATEATMPRTPPSPEKLAEAQALAEAIREATAAEIDELARTLVTTDDQHLFGANEFRIRDLAHRIAAAALQQHLARKKTTTANLAGSR